MPSGCSTTCNLAAQDNCQSHVAPPGFEQHIATLDGSAVLVVQAAKAESSSRPLVSIPIEPSRQSACAPRYLFQVIVIVRQKLLACQCLFPVAEINRRSVFGKSLIWVAVQPAFARLS
jgi:hypothetical protein